MAPQRIRWIVRNGRAWRVRLIAQWQARSNPEKPHLDSPARTKFEFLTIDNQSTGQIETVETGADGVIFYQDEVAAIMVAMQENRDLLTLVQWRYERLDRRLAELSQ